MADDVKNRSLIGFEAADVETPHAVKEAQTEVTPEERSEEKWCRKTVVMSPASSAGRSSATVQDWRPPGATNDSHGSDREVLQLLTRPPSDYEPVSAEIVV